MRTKEVSDTRQAAYDFAAKHGVKLEILSEEYGSHFEDDKKAGTERWIFKCKLTRKGKSYTFNFGQSIAAGSENPDLYDVLATMEKSDPEDFENFCANYGYSEDSRTAERVYKAVCREYKAIQRLFSDVMDELCEIA